MKTPGIVCAALVALLTFPSMGYATEVAPATLVEIADSPDHHWHSVPCTALITQGKFSGQQTTFDIHFYGHPQFDPHLKPGDPIILQIEDDPESGKIATASFAQYRIWPVLLVLSLIFAAAVFAAGRFAGLRGLFGTAASVAALLLALHCCLHFGLPPLPTIVGTGLTAIVLSVLLLFRHQPRARKLAAWSISCAFLANAALSTILVRFLKIQGQSLEGARDLILGFHSNLTALPPESFWQILAAAMPISTLGAMFDSAVVLAVSLDEMTLAARKNHAPLNGTELAHSSLQIGRDLFTTLFLTLFFAHVGIFAPLWTVAFRTDAPILFLLNSEWITIGLAIVTVSAGGLIFSVLATKFLAPKILLTP